MYRGYGYYQTNIIIDGETLHVFEPQKGVPVNAEYVITPLCCFPLLTLNF